MSGTEHVELPNADVDHTAIRNTENADGSLDGPSLSDAFEIVEVVDLK